MSSIIPKVTCVYFAEKHLNNWVKVFKRMLNKTLETLAIKGFQR